MLIKFLDSDPRAGSVARMDSQRGQQLIDAGAAERVNEDGSAAVNVVPAGHSVSVGAPVVKPSEGLKVEELKAALAANGVEIPEGVTKKSDLAALLDGQAA